MVGGEQMRIVDSRRVLRGYRKNMDSTNCFMDFISKPFWELLEVFLLCPHIFSPCTISLCKPQKTVNADLYRWHVSMCRKLTNSAGLQKAHKLECSVSL